MENILEKCYQDLLKSDLLPEDLVVYERKKIHQIIERISKEHKIGDFLLKDGRSVAEAPADAAQIEGIWLTENCLAAPCLSEKKLSFDEAKKFCLRQRILGIPLHLPSDVRGPPIAREQLRKVGFDTFQDVFYWSSLPVSGQQDDLYAVWNPFSFELNYLFAEQKTWCYAVLELPD